MKRVSSQPLEIFYCYARKDRELRDELDIHLAGLRRSGPITAWYDGAISPGIAWEQEIAIHLDTARIILLLISPDFIHSDYCYSKEMARAIERHRCNEACVIPILLRPADWTGTPFSKLQMLPSNTLPITRWPDRDEAFEDVVKGIHQVVKELLHANSIISDTPVKKQIKANSTSKEKDSSYSKLPEMRRGNTNIGRLSRPSNSRVAVHSKVSYSVSTHAVTTYNDALKARERGELAEAVRLWQEIRHLDPRFQTKEILSFLEIDLWQLAEQCACSGRWEEEIKALQALEEVLKPKIIYDARQPTYPETRLGELLKIAEKNQSYTKVYEKAKQHLQENNIADATQCLELLWKNVPYYGDPAKLAIQVGMQAPDREMLQGKNDDDNFINHSLPRGLGTSPENIQRSAFSFLVGSGSFVGILTQSWLWAGSMSLLLALSFFILRPYRSVNIIRSMILFLISIALVCGVAWYASTLNYNQPHVSHLWFIGDRTLWPHQQIYFGLASGILIGFIWVWSIWEIKNRLENNCSCFPLLLLLLLLFWLASTFFGWGFGYGFGWPLAICGCLVGCVGAAGLIRSITIWIKYGRYLASRKEWTWYR